METEPTRFSLIEKVKSQQNEEAWQLFCETYKHYINSVVVKLGVHLDDANDLNQDILLKFWKKLPDFDYEPSKGRFRTWLYEVIRNHVYDYLSSRTSRNSQMNQSLEKWNAPATQSEIKLIMDKEWRAYVTSLAMKRIEGSFLPQNIEIFNRLLRGESSQQLAEAYRVKPNSINKVKNRIKERLIVEIAEIRNEVE